MDNDFVDYEGYADPIAARTQAYMWLFESLVSVKDVNPELFDEGMTMLRDVRQSIEKSDRAVLKSIRGGK